MKQNKSYYFSHDYNSRNDVKILFLRQQLGIEGYGIFWFLVESLAESGGMLPLKIVPVLAMQMQIPEVKVSAVIQNFELFEIQDNEFFSNRLNEHLAERKLLSEKGKQGAINRWRNSPPNSPPIGEGNAKKESKESKESKEIGLPPIAPEVEKIESIKTPPPKKIFAPPEKSEVVDFMCEKLDDFTAQAQADLFINYYNSNGWKVGKNKMQNWKAAAAGWISRMKNFNNDKQLSTADRQAAIRKRLYNEGQALYAAIQREGNNNP